MATDAQKRWPHQNAAALNKFYGNPKVVGNEADPVWEAKSIRYWTPPYPMFYSDAKKSPFRRGLRVHVNCHKLFTDAFTDALQTLGHEFIKANRLDISGGTYVPRLERNGSALSVHSWGCAIDMDPANNPFPKRWRKGMISIQFVEILEKHGFTWRGRNGDIDPMHFQAAWRS